MPTKEELENYYQDTTQHIVNVQRQMYKVIEKPIGNAISDDENDSEN